MPPVRPNKKKKIRTAKPISEKTMSGNSDLLAYSAVFLFLILTVVLISALMMWILYGRLRCFTPYRIIKDSRRLAMAGIIILSSTFLVSIVWMVVCKQAPDWDQKSFFLTATAAIILFLAGILISAILTYAWIKTKKLKAKNAAMMGAALSNTCILLVFLTMVVISAKASKARIYDTIFEV
jgi:hypothetical protein